MKIYLYLGHEQFQPEELVEHARLAEAHGFDGVAVSDHFHPWVDDVGAAGFVWSTLAAIAQTTDKLELLTAVVTPLWHMHPAVVAQAAATVDRLSGGRFALGVGTGRSEGALGYPFPGYAERAARMEEAITIMRRLLDGERVDSSGRYYKTVGAKLYSPPMHRVPIYMSAAGPKSAKLAARITDGLILSVKDTDDVIQKVVEPARAVAVEAKRPAPTIVASQWTIRGSNDDEAWEALKPWRGLRAPNRDSEIDPAKLRQAADELPRDQVLGQYHRVQTADDYVAVYGELARRLQPDILGIQTTSVEQGDTIRLLGHEVLPKLRAQAAEFKQAKEGR